jgi:hypothetical protein
MEKIEGWRGLEKYGILMLTGEACGIGMRLLCDLTPEGVDNLGLFFSNHLTVGNNWNGSDGQIASIMLPYHMWRDLAAFFLLGDGYEVAVDVNWQTDYASANYVEGMSMEEWLQDKERFFKIYDGNFKVYLRSGTAKQGLRNRHVFSGRVE